jgi:hypothetical protein
MNTLNLTTLTLPQMIQARSYFDTIINATQGLGQLGAAAVGNQPSASRSRAVTSGSTRRQTSGLSGVQAATSNDTGIGLPAGIVGGQVQTRKRGPMSAAAKRKRAATLRAKRQQAEQGGGNNQGQSNL